MKQPETAYNGDSANIHAESTYDRWVREQEIPDIRGFSIEDLNEVRVVPWDRMGGLGAFIHLEGSEEELTDAYACEIPAGAQLKPQKHLYEETVFVVGGRGATAVWYEGGRRAKRPWKPTAEGSTAEELPIYILFTTADHIAVRAGVRALDDHTGGEGGGAPYGAYTRNAHVWDLA